MPISSASLTKSSSSFRSSASSPASSLSATASAVGLSALSGTFRSRRRNAAYSAAKASASAREGGMVTSSYSVSLGSSMPRSLQTSAKCFSTSVMMPFAVLLMVSRLARNSGSSAFFDHVAT